MSLIKCPECGKDVSDTVENCIYCGYVTKQTDFNEQNQKSDNKFMNDNAAISFIKTHKKPIIYSIISIVVIISLCCIGNYLTKKSAMDEIYTEISDDIDRVYGKTYALEYGLGNISVSVDNIDSYLGEKHACVSIYCNVDIDANEAEKALVGWDIMDVLPDKVETSSYGDVSVGMILYKPDNDSFGVSIYMNDELVFIHGQTIAGYGKYKSTINKHNVAEKNYDDYMDAQDWGDGYYYDSSDNEVKKTLW